MTYSVDKFFMRQILSLTSVLEKIYDDYRSFQGDHL